MPSIVSPVKQNVPVRWRPFRPTADANDAWTRARRLPCDNGKLGGSGAVRMNRSSESIVMWWCEQPREGVSVNMCEREWRGGGFLFRYTVSMVNTVGSPSTIISISIVDWIYTYFDGRDGFVTGIFTFMYILHTDHIFDVYLSKY